MNGNIGDSWCAMGRIGYFDALARARVGDQHTFDDILLEPLLTDLLENTWLRERFGCDGLQQLNRTAYYFEYPATVSIMLREVRYGINIGLNQIVINPLMAANSTFTYHVGNVNVDYSVANLTLSFPGTGKKSLVIYGLL